jgi:hypothetical protein
MPPRRAITPKEPITGSKEKVSTKTAAKAAEGRASGSGRTTRVKSKKFIESESEEEAGDGKVVGTGTGTGKAKAKVTGMATAKATGTAILKGKGKAVDDDVIMQESGDDGNAAGKEKERPKPRRMGKGKESEVVKAQGEGSGKGKRKAVTVEDVDMDEVEEEEAAAPPVDKGKRKATVEEVEDEDEMDIEEVGGGVGGGVSTEDQEAQRAIISLNKIDFRNPGFQILFNLWNNRPVVTRHVKQLLASMHKQGVRAYNPANRIPLIVAKGDIETGCISLDPHLGADAPTLKVNASGQETGKIRAAGGQHRYHAWKLAQEQGTASIEKYEGQLAGLHVKEPKGEKAKATRQANIERLEGEIKREKDFIDAISVWGVVVYDAGE